MSGQRNARAEKAVRQMAVRTREALNLLGFPATEDCLPDEANPCGFSHSTHVWTNLVYLQALVEHHLSHVEIPPDLVGECRRTADESVLRLCQRFWHPEQHG